MQRECRRFNTLLLRPAARSCLMRPPLGGLPMPRLVRLAALAVATGWLALPAAEPAATFDLLVRNGTVYDGSGQPGRRADVGVRGDTIAAVGDLTNAAAKTT